MNPRSKTCLRTRTYRLYSVGNRDIFGESLLTQSVPGFSGWGAPLLGSLNYWGGVQDIPNLLMKQGHTVIVSSIAPLSSNWERACELYKELTCGKYVGFDILAQESQCLRNQIHCLQCHRRGSVGML